MKIVKAYPPNYDKIVAAFHPEKSYLFTYGDTIYHPSGTEIRKDILIHEEVHFRQQTRWFLMSPTKWWNRYIDDRHFRFDQELLAYREQWQFIDTHTNRETKRQLLGMIARDLSSKNYGNLCNYDEAVKKITGA